MSSYRRLFWYLLFRYRWAHHLCFLSMNNLRQSSFFDIYIHMYTYKLYHEQTKWKPDLHHKPLLICLLFQQQACAQWPFTKNQKNPNRSLYMSRTVYIIYIRGVASIAFCLWSYYLMISYFCRVVIYWVRSLTTKNKICDGCSNWN